MQLPMLSEPAAFDSYLCLELLFSGVTWVTALLQSVWVMCSIRVWPALCHTGCCCTFEAVNWNFQVCSPGSVSNRAVPGPLLNMPVHVYVCVCSLHKECLAASCVEWDYVNMLICPQWRHSHQRLHAIVKRDRQWERKGGREGVEKMSGRAVKVWCAIWSSVTNRVNAERSFDGRVRTGLRMKMKKKACKWKQQDRWARWKVLRWFAWK